ncbi:hypothetical protein SJDPG2_09135 [Porphyromonas gingivalis SJD2]|nr:hypothetical protein SJDPG2_09135 [Porphyromonas gingivalis SJD2]OWR77122.1 hypothetical protein SJDPG5_06860 [Porphyromonas gingivalis SJD5]
MISGIAGVDEAMPVRMTLVPPYQSAHLSAYAYSHPDANKLEPPKKGIGHLPLRQKHEP